MYKKIITTVIAVFGLISILTLPLLLLSGCGSVHNVGTYTVAYEANGATSGDVPTDPTSYQSDLSVTVLGNPGNLQKAGYSFGGWNTLADGSGIAYTQGQKFSIKTSNARLYAMWTNDNAHTVTYDSNGSTGGSVPSDSNLYKVGFIVTILGNTGDLVKAGFTFAGWNTAADGSGTNYTQADTFTMGAANVILYANWTTNPTYTVTYDGNTATSGDVPVDTTHYLVGDSVSVFDNTGNLEKTGSTFTGWNTAADGTGTTYSFGEEFAMASANVVLYAKWTVNPTYTVTYYGNGNTSGNAPADLTNYETGQEVYVPKNTGNLEKTGYIFEGWNTRADGTGTNYTHPDFFLMGSIDITLFAKWTLKLWTVTFDSQGGSAVASQAVIHGEKASEPADPTKTGATFAGWFKESACINPWDFESDTVTAQTTLYAKWTDHVFTVLFHSNGGSSVPFQSITYGQKAVRPVDPAKTGETFAGWFKDRELTESWNFGVDTVKTNITLYAKWTAAVYTLTFNSVGGSSVQEQEVKYGGKAFMPARPTNGNLALAGWYTDIAYTSQWSFATDTVTDNMTLYARWKTYSLRDTGPAGGLVFYDKGSYSDGWRYIEAFPQDLYDKGATTFLWGNLVATTATDDGVGKGASNTDKIIDTYGLFSAPYAARQCREAIAGDYSDWIMPSYNEMDYMRTNLAKQGVGGFENTYYWSSTEDNKNKSYVLLFRNSTLYSSVNKGLKYRVRPARYF